MRGLFVVLEGSDGAGKSTFRERFEKKMEELKIPHLCTREPGGSKVGEKIRRLLLDPDNAMDARCEALLYAAARAEHVEKTVKPALEKGLLVLSERYVISSLAYQGYGRNLGKEAIWKINEFATAKLMPDVTLFFYISPEESLRRKTESLDRLELEAMDFHERTRVGYEELIHSLPVNLIHADKSPEEVYKEGEKVILDAWRRCNG